MWTVFGWKGLGIKEINALHKKFTLKTISLMFGGSTDA